MFSAGVEPQDFSFVSLSYLQTCLDILGTEVRQNYQVVSDISQGVNDGPHKGTQYPQAVTVWADIVISNQQNIATILSLKSIQDLVGMVLWR